MGKGKNDVYVAVRSYAGIFKVSLHESGDCFVGLTTQFAEHNSSALTERGGSRHFDTWKRKTQREDRVEVLAIVVPQDERSERAELDHNEKESPEVAVTRRITQGSVRDHCTRSR